MKMKKKNRVRSTISASFVFSALSLSLDTLARAFPQFPPVASVRRLVLVITPSPGEETKETPGEEIKLLFRKEELIRCKRFDGGSNHRRLSRKGKRSVLPRFNSRLIFATSRWRVSALLRSPPRRRRPSSSSACRTAEGLCSVSFEFFFRRRRRVVDVSYRSYHRSRNPSPSCCGFFRSLWVILIRAVCLYDHVFELPVVSDRRRRAEMPHTPSPSSETISSSNDFSLTLFFESPKKILLLFHLQQASMTSGATPVAPPSSSPSLPRDAATQSSPSASRRRPGAPPPSSTSCPVNLLTRTA